MSNTFEPSSDLDKYTARTTQEQAQQTSLPSTHQSTTIQQQQTSMSSTSQQQPTTTSTSETPNPATQPTNATSSSTMAPTTTSKPSSRSHSPTNNGSRSGSPKRGLFSAYNERLSHMNFNQSTPLDAPVEHHHHHHHSKPRSGSTTPEKKQGYAQTHGLNAPVFKTVEQHLDRAFASHARPTQQAAVEEAKREGEERQHKTSVFGLIEKRMDKAFDTPQNR